MTLECAVLTAAGLIPTRFAFTGVPGAKNISLPLAWRDPPEETRSFALTIVDRHPVANNWVHWCVVNLPASTRSLPEGASGDTARMPAGAVQFRNSFGTVGYGGPQPPKGSGPHEYVITLYALAASSLPAKQGESPARVMKEIAATNIAAATIVGIFEQ